MWKIKLLLPLLLISCTSLNLQKTRYPSSVQGIYEIPLDFTPRKVLYSSVDRTIYIMATNKIHIFREGKKVNTVGGLGFEQNRFNKLTDISLTPDGKLFALDSFQKIIRKFDRHGNWIADIRIKDLPSPTLLAVDSDGTLFIYDNNLREIVTIQNYGSKKMYSFGKFIIEDPNSINLSGNELTVYDRKLDKTIIFSRMGRFLDEYEGRILSGRNGSYILKKNFVLQVETDKKLAISPFNWTDFNLVDNYLILLSDKIVMITELKYEEE